MATTIFLILCAAAETFFLYALVHFGCESRSSRGSRNDSSRQAPRLHIPSPLFGGPHPVAIWSEGTWDHILSGGNVSQSGCLDTERN